MIFSDKKILILIAHPADESLYFYEGIKQLSSKNSIDILCLTNSSTSVRGKELQQAMCELNAHIIFRNISDKGIHSLMLNVENHIATALDAKNYCLLITYPPHGSEKSHPYHIQCFHIARRLSHQRHLRFGFFSEKKIDFTELKPETYLFSNYKNFKNFLNYALLFTKVKKFPLKNLREIKNEFFFFLGSILRPREYLLVSYYPKLFDKQSTLGIYISQISSLMKMKTYLCAVEYLYLER